MSLSFVVAGPAAWIFSVAATPATAAMQQVGVPDLKIASLNLAMNRDPDLIAAEIKSHPALANADILFLQEVVRGSENDASVAQALAARLGRHATFASPDGGSTVGGLAILSRFPLKNQKTYALKPQNLIFRSRKRIAIAATVESPLGSVRLINTHLDTRINPAERVKQLGPALEDAQAFEGAAIIGGDFNTNDMQWVSNVVPVPFPGWQASRVRILMESRGFNTPFQTRRATFDHMGMQLDWIYTNRLRALRSGIQPIEFSDHHAVWVQLVEKTAQPAAIPAKAAAAQ